jgi:hypothetical protein
MANAGFPEAVLELDDVQATAKTLGLELAVLEIRRADDIAPSFEGLNGGVGAEAGRGRAALTAWAV